MQPSHHIKLHLSAPRCGNALIGDLGKPELEDWHEAFSSVSLVFDSQPGPDLRECKEVVDALQPRPQVWDDGKVKISLAHHFGLKRKHPCCSSERHSSGTYRHPRPWALNCAQRKTVLKADRSRQMSTDLTARDRSRTGTVEPRCLVMVRLILLWRC